MTQAAAQTLPSPAAALEQIDGVGPQLAQAILAHFKTVARFLHAAKEADIETLAKVEGISERKAIEIVRQVLGIDSGQHFLATPAGRKVHDEVVERLLSFAATAAGRNRIKILGPWATPAQADRHARLVMEHKAMVSQLDRDTVRRLLRRIRSPVEATPRFETSRIAICENDAIQERAMGFGLQRWVSVTGAKELEQAADYDLALFLYEDGLELQGLDNVVELPGDAPLEALAPESVLAWFTANKEPIAATSELAQLLAKTSQASEALGLLQEAQQARTTPVGLRKETEAVRQLLDVQLRQRLAQVQVTGVELLDSMGRKLPASIQKAIDEVLREGRLMMKERTGCDFQPFTPTSPLGIDEQELAATERGLQTRGAIASFQHLARIAKRLAALRPIVTQEIAGWQAFDLPFALGCFAHHYDLRPARFGNALAFTDSIHLDLADKPDCQRIAYHLGREENVALLTGANSGGKTTLLEHMAQLALMARMGLPVVGDVEVPWVEELHYVTARRSLDAGAFESFLRSFLPIAMGTQRRLVLADEVESVTELEAAGRILGFFLDRIAKSESLAVVVSHMAPQILRHCHAPLRIDGIEATGLDADNRLVVDRMPRMGFLARSTPEFIVQRLAATAKGSERELYDSLLAVFRADQPADAVMATAARKGKRKA